MQPTSTFLTFLLLCAASAAPCYTGCNFHVCSGDSTIGPGGPDAALTAPICLPGGKPVSIVASTGEAKVNGVTKISEYAPPGLLQRFAPSFFKAYGNAIGHEALQRNQGEFLNNMCVSIPILAYCTVGANKTVVNHVSTAGTDCIALRVSLGGPRV